MVCSKFGSLQPPRLKRGASRRPAWYRDSSSLMMAVVQMVWRKSYEQIVDYVATHRELAVTLGFEGRTISQGHYWERRSALGILPFLFFFALAAQFFRLGVIAGQELIVDSSLLSAWRGNDPGAIWQKYAVKQSVFGFKVHTVLCHPADLPLFALVTQAHVHDPHVGWFVILVTACCLACWKSSYFFVSTRASNRKPLHPSPRPVCLRTPNQIKALPPIQRVR